MRLPEPTPLVLDHCQSTAVMALMALPSAYRPNFKNGVIIEPPVMLDPGTGQALVVFHIPGSHLKGGEVDLRRIPENARAVHSDRYTVRLVSESLQWQHGSRSWKVVNVRARDEDLPFVISKDGFGNFEVVITRAGSAAA